MKIKLKSKEYLIYHKKKYIGYISKDHPIGPDKKRNWMFTQYDHQEPKINPGKHKKLKNMKHAISLALLQKAIASSPTNFKMTKRNP